MYPNMFLLQSPGLPFSCPVCSRRSAVSLSLTTVSSLISDRSTWEEEDSRIYKYNKHKACTPPPKIKFNSWFLQYWWKTWTPHQPSLISLDSAFEPFAFLPPAQVWAACSFLSAAQTWEWQWQCYKPLVNVYMHEPPMTTVLTRVCVNLHCFLFWVAWRSMVRLQKDDKLNKCSCCHNDSVYL